MKNLNDIIGELRLMQIRNNAADIYYPTGQPSGRLTLDGNPSSAPSYGGFSSSQTTDPLACVFQNPQNTSTEESVNGWAAIVHQVLVEVAGSGGTPSVRLKGFGSGSPANVFRFDSPTAGMQLLPGPVIMNGGFSIETTGTTAPICLVSYQIIKP